MSLFGAPRRVQETSKSGPKGALEGPRLSKWIPRQVNWPPKSTPKAVQEHSIGEKSKTAKSLILLGKRKVCQGLRVFRGTSESPRKAFGRRLDLQVELLDRLWTAKLAPQTALGFQVELPMTLSAAK